MSRPTIASLQREIDTLKRQIAGVGVTLADFAETDDWRRDSDELVETIAETLNLEVNAWQDIVWTISVRGRVKASKNADPSDFELTVRDQTVQCSDMGVAGREFQDMEVSVEEVFFD